MHEVRVFAMTGLGTTLTVPALGGSIRISLLVPGEARIIFAPPRNHVAVGPAECRALAVELLNIAELLDAPEQPDAA